MKKRYYFIIGYIIFVIILMVFINRSLEPPKLGKTYKEMYDSLDYFVSQIESNMNDITIGNNDINWLELKQTNLNDEKLKETYNLLISDIRTCYLLTNDLDNKTYDNIKILNFKDKRDITLNEISQLNQNKNCLDNFNKYNSLILSDNKELSENIKIKIGIIIDYQNELNDYKDFDKLLYKETAIMSRIANLSKWLKIEYNTYKI